MHRCAEFASMRCAGKPPSAGWAAPSTTPSSSPTACWETKPPP